MVEPSQGNQWNTRGGSVGSRGMSCDLRAARAKRRAGEQLDLVQFFAQQATHQLPSDVEDDGDEGDEGEDQERAAGEDKRRRFVNKRKLGRELGKAELSRHIRNDGHGL